MHVIHQTRDPWPDCVMNHGIGSNDIDLIIDYSQSGIEKFDISIQFHDCEV